MIRIVKATRRSLPGLLPLMRTLREEMDVAGDSASLMKSYAQMMNRSMAKVHIIMATEGRFPIGYVAGGFSPDLSMMGPVFWIQELYIDKPYRGGGVLRAMLDWTRGFVLARGGVGIEVRLRRIDIDLVTLAEALRFEPTGRQIFRLDFDLD